MAIRIRTIDGQTAEVRCLQTDNDRAEIGNIVQRSGHPYSNGWVLVEVDERR